MMQVVEKLEIFPDYPFYQNYYNWKNNTLRKGNSGDK